MYSTSKNDRMKPRTPSVGHFYRIKNLFIKSLLFCNMHAFTLESGVQVDKLLYQRLLLI